MNKKIKILSLMVSAIILGTSSNIFAATTNKIIPSRYQVSTTKSTFAEHSFVNYFGTGDTFYTDEFYPNGGGIYVTPYKNNFWGKVNVTIESYDSATKKWTPFRTTTATNGSMAYFTYNFYSSPTCPYRAKIEYSLASYGQIYENSNVKVDYFTEE